MRFFSSYAHPAFSHSRKPYFGPATDIVETKDALKLKVELPGFEREQIKVEVVDGVLSIRGEREQKEDVNEGELLRSEIYSDSIERSFQIGEDLDAAKIAASYKNGILELSLPKVEAARPKAIAVEVK